MDDSISEDQAADLQPKNSTTAFHDKNGDDRTGQEVVDKNIRGITSKMTSPCWQWNQAVQILQDYVQHVQDDSLPPLNNHVFASLLKLNGKASQAFAHKHNGPDMALFVLDLMQELDISPDVVTCSLIIKDFGDQWRSAVALLESMKSASILSHNSSSWRLPAPNVYTYSAVIATCARCHQYELVTQLLEELRMSEHREKGVVGGGPPNAWVYNAALLATTGCESMAVLASNPSWQEKHSDQAKRKERLLLALRLLKQMEQDFANGSNTSPDTVTFNTILVTLNGIEEIDSLADQEIFTLAHEHFLSEVQIPSPEMDDKNSSSILLQERLVNSILDRMKAKNIMRDSITYRNVIIAVRTCGHSAIVRVLDQALLDKDCILQVALSGSPNARQLDGRAAEGLSFVFDTALSLMASQGHIEGVIATLSKMLAHNILPTHETTNHLMTALGRGYSSPAIPILVRALVGSAEGKYELAQQYGVPENLTSMLTWDKASHYSIAISESLAADDIETTRSILAIMHDKGVRPTDLSLQEIARAYSQVAMKAAAREAKWEQKERLRKQRGGKGLSSKRFSRPYIQKTSRARARSAYNIAMNIVKDPTPALLSTVARACANCGLWEQARFILRTMHKNILDADNMSTTHVLKGSSRRVVRGLHQGLLRAASIQGNVTAALWFVDDIQKLSTRLMKRKERQEELLSQQHDHQHHTENFMSLKQSDFGTQDIDDLGMKLEDWKLLLIAASKCGHWRVCLSTLQFLRPYLEATNPAMANGAIERSTFKRQYEEIAPALTVAVKCLEVRSQYGWALRAIDDWFEWSGRRPPKAAVLAAIRILAVRSRPTEVHKLLTRCITHETGWTNSSSPNGSNTYEAMLYVGAITALHNEGLYDDADDAFCAALSRGALPFLLTNIEINGVPRMVLDLHGMNLPVAHSAVRVALQQEVESASWNRTGGIKSVEGFSLWNNDMIIVTGRGLNSALRMRPILRPEVQRMLVEEFYPPLNTVSVPGNMGAVQVAAEDISAWLSHQRRQKGARMLAVAAVLKNVSSLDRLRERLARSSEKEENSG